MSNTNYDEDLTESFEADRSIGSSSVTTDFVWDNYDMEVKHFDENPDYIESGNVCEEDILNNIAEATEEIRSYEMDNSGLQRLFPNPQSGMCINSDAVNGNTGCATTDSKESILELFAVNIHNFHDTDTVMKNIYEISRQQLIVPESHVIMSQYTCDLIVNNNPYRNRTNDTMGSRLDQLFAFIWDSAVLSTMNMTNYLGSKSNVN